MAAGISRKVNSLLWGTVFGLAVGLFLAYLVAAMQGKYYFQIMLPGGILGLAVGLATQKFPEKDEQCRASCILKSRPRIRPGSARPRWSGGILLSEWGTGAKRA